MDIILKKLIQILENVSSYEKIMKKGTKCSKNYCVLKII